MLTTQNIIASASEAIFGKPLVTNVYRSVIVEAIVAAALPDWEWCSADYAAHDFIHPDGTRLEVKQSAMKQTWATKGTPKPSWDIAARTGVWENGTDWIDRPGRNADIYVLGLHDVLDDTADHRDPSQWRFFVIPANRLPASKRIGLSSAQRLVGQTSVDGLASAVGAAARNAQAAERLTWQAGDVQSG